MQFKKTHTPLVPRTANYSCSLTNRSSRKKSSSTQTEKYWSPFQNWFGSNQSIKDDFTFNEETTNVYSMALEYINRFHSYMNMKLTEKYGERGDTKPEGTVFFKLPDVPNYSSVFSMLLEKTREPKLTTNQQNVTKRKDKGLEEFKVLEPNTSSKEVKMTEQGVQTVLTLLKDDDSATCPSNTISDDLSSFDSKNSNFHSSPSDDSPDMEKESLKGNVIPNIKGNFDDQERHKGDESSKKEDEIIVISPERSDNAQANTQTIKADINDKIAMIDIIKRRVQEEITTILDRNNPITDHRPRLIKSHFHVINIPPQINLLEYAQKKLERQLATERAVSTADMPPKHFYNNSVSTRKSLNIRPTTPKKVTNMFRKLSEEKIKHAEATVRGNLCSYDQSDGDSIILDDEEFEKINGYVENKFDIQRKRNNSATREKSNPLKLTTRDMTKVDEKMLNAIGLFTERGDIRPDVIDILEEQKKAKAKDARNKQFRSRRQWDLQIHLNPKPQLDSSLTSVSTEKSFISVSSTELRLTENASDSRLC